MEGIHNLLRGSIDKNDGKLDDLVQIGPRVLFARALEVEHTNDLRGGALFWWWRRRRSWSLSLFASLASSGLDSRQSGAFRGQRGCHHCRDECETHGALPGSPLFVRVLRKRRAITHCAPRRLQRAVAVACSWSPSSAATTCSFVLQRLYTTNYFSRRV